MEAKARKSSSEEQADYVALPFVLLSPGAVLGCPCCRLNWRPSRCSGQSGMRTSWRPSRCPGQSGVRTSCRRSGSSLVLVVVFLERMCVSLYVCVCVCACVSSKMSEVFGFFFCPLEESAGSEDLAGWEFEARAELRDGVARGFPKSGLRMSLLGMPSRRHGCRFLHRA